MITDYRGSALGPVQTNVRALALIDENPNASSNGPGITEYIPFRVVSPTSGL
jgi:hypothetical protein